MPVTTILPGALVTSEFTHLRPVASTSAVLVPEGVTAKWRV